MRPWILIGLGAFAILFVLGTILTLLPRQRAMAEQEACKNNFRILAQFATDQANPPKDAPARRVGSEIPAGTIPLPGVAADDRLSWVVDTLPGFDQRQQNTAPMLAAIDRSQPWSASKNQAAARMRVAALLDPGNPPELDPDRPAPTQYVGIAGLGTDAGSLNFVPPGPPSPRAGCFRYDGPTPFYSIADGSSQTLLFGECSEDLGSWLRGGASTIRGLDDRPGAKPLVGPGGQFGGNHPNTSNWALADGSVRMFTPRVDPRVLFGMATIAGKESDAIPGE